MRWIFTILCCGLGCARPHNGVQELQRELNGDGQWTSEANASSSRQNTVSCHVCDLAAVRVPQEVGWMLETHPHFVNELFRIEDPDAVWKYWDRVEEFGRTKKGLHETCHFVRHIPSNVARIAARKNGAGVLIALRGDSHSRVTMQAVARSLTRERSAFFEMNYDTSVVHSDHLFCCAVHNEHTFAFSQCTSESGPAVDPKSIRYRNAVGLTGTIINAGNFSDLRVRAKERVGRGEVCVAWENRNRFREDETEKYGSVNALQRWADAGVAPDLFVANNGAHYNTRELSPDAFRPEVGDWLRATASALEHSPLLLATTTVVVMSSPANGFVSWDAQDGGYEVMRQEVLNLAQTHPTAFARTSYLDMHALTGTDSCGFTTRFPHYTYMIVARNKCDNHYLPTDAHLANGAYLHIAETAVNIAALNSVPPEAHGHLGARIAEGGAPWRRCDPPRFTPPPDAVAFNENKGVAGENLGKVVGRRSNPLTGKTFLQGRPEALLAT